MALHAEPLGIDIAALDLQDALDVAILIEQDACERYEELADSLELHHTADAARFFRLMVGNERKHAERLRAQRTKLFADAESRVAPLAVPEIEAPAYESVRAFMTHHAALRTAMKSEVRAFEFYAAALEVAQDEAVRALFAELVDEEKHHQELVQREIDKLPPEERTDADDFVDPPVAL